jgi:hypothetical protein
LGLRFFGKRVDCDFIACSLALTNEEYAMRKFHSIAALCGDGLRPELQDLFNRLAIDEGSELFKRNDGMMQSGPDPASEVLKAVPLPIQRTSK